jgi:hypothetical protein
MDISLSCPVCDFEGKQFFAVKLDQQNDCIYKITCPKGHEFKSNILFHPFQKLFEIAVHAIVDGYLREAVGSFAASYERFMELFLRVTRDVREIDTAMFDKSWKLISNQSERQLGAYIYAHLLEFGTQPEILSSAIVKLRNKVIHQGYIPTETEAISYGNHVQECILSVIGRIFESPKHHKKLIDGINEFGDFTPEGPMATLYPWHMIPTNRSPDAERKTVEDHIKVIRTLRHKS